MASSGKSNPQSGVPIVNELLVAAVVANLADLATFLRVSPNLVAAQETNPLPHLLGPTVGAFAAKLVMALLIIVTLVVFKKRPRTKFLLVATYTVLAFVGAASNLMAA